MNMLQGTLIVEAAGSGESGTGEATAGQTATATTEAPERHDHEHNEHAGHTHGFARAVGVGPTLQVGELESVELAIFGGGVTCPTCVTNIEGFINELPGVDDIQVNFGAERVGVRFDPTQVSVDDMEAAVRSGGYTVRRREKPGSPETEDQEAAERRAEQRDLTRRVLVGAVLTAPVLFGMMTHEFFSPDWLPSIFLNHWFQLILITPVMFYTGWPIHHAQHQAESGVRVRIQDRRDTHRGRRALPVLRPTPQPCDRGCCHGAQFPVRRHERQPPAPLPSARTANPSCYRIRHDCRRGQWPDRTRASSGGRADGHRNGSRVWNDYRFSNRRRPRRVRRGDLLLLLACLPRSSTLIQLSTPPALRDEGRIWSGARPSNQGRNSPWSCLPPSTGAKLARSTADTGTPEPKPEPTRDACTC